MPPLDPPTPAGRAGDAGFKFACILFPAVMIYVVLTDTDGCGDTPMDYRFFSIAGGAALVLTLVWCFIDRQRRDYSRLQYALQILVRYFLAYTIMYYGTGKVADIQFFPSIFNLDTPVADMRPMGVAWAFFGYSFSYEFFIGCSQIIAAILLLFRRTATLGAILMVPIMANIVYVNFAFDICVKFFSCAYLAMSVYLLLDDAKRLANLLLFNRTAEKRIYPELFRSRKGQSVFKAVCAVLMIFAFGFPIYKTRAAILKYQIGQHSALYGYWTIDSLHDSRDSLNAVMNTGSGAWKKFIFEDFRNSAIKSLQSTTGYFTYDVDTLHHRLTMKENYPDTLMRINGTYSRRADTVIVVGSRDSDSIYLRMHLQRKYFIRDRN